MWNRRDARQEEYRKSGMQVRRDAGNEGFRTARIRTGGLHERRDSGLE